MSGGRDIIMMVMMMMMVTIAVAERIMLMK